FGSNVAADTLNAVYLVFRQAPANCAPAHGWSLWHVDNLAFTQDTLCALGKEYLLRDTGAETRYVKAMVQCLSNTGSAKAWACESCICSCWAHTVCQQILNEVLVRLTRGSRS
ncbi:unnamed protein product, partial [Mycena citricolor]